MIEGPFRQKNEKRILVPAPLQNVGRKGGLGERLRRSFFSGEIFCVADHIIFRRRDLKNRILTSHSSVSHAHKHGIQNKSIPSLARLADGEFVFFLFSFHRCKERFHFGVEKFSFPKPFVWGCQHPPPENQRPNLRGPLAVNLSGAPPNAPVTPRGKRRSTSSPMFSPFSDSYPLAA